LAAISPYWEAKLDLFWLVYGKEFDQNQIINSGPKRRSQKILSDLSNPASVFPFWKAKLTFLAGSMVREGEMQDLIRTRNINSGPKRQSKKIHPDLPH
jgi:hypothetical protein